MINFDFSNPTRILFGEGAAKSMANYIPEDAKVLVVYDSIIEKIGTLDKVLSTISNEVIKFDKIQSNPKFEILMEAVEIVRQEKVNFILAVGGGSTMDGAKFISLAAHNEAFIGNEADILHITPMTDARITQSIPVGTVVTLPATGSEMNPHAVISHGEDKLGISSPFAYPAFSVLDPTYTFTLPKSQIANGIADSFIHTAEQYVTYPAEGRFQDRTAEGIMRTIVEVAQDNLEQPENYDARANLMWCSTMALNGLIGSGVPVDFATHMIGHEVTSLFGIAHAPSLVIIMPALWRVRKEQKAAKLLQYAERVWDITEGTDDEKIDAAIDKTEEFFRSLGLKTRFSDYGYTFKDVEPVLDLLEKHNMTALSETGDLDLTWSKRILEAAM
ncbi:iron-containing alcohol dehydrogenase [Photobacterium sp. ZSDE20]|uniref:Iron-containing alcohol dehydrogenase n=1 Tax=Photobacterium pectinilyticum TaxID=2906793 RepID=A0ABT1N7T9_9GAMM|nr:iron-containing alcohol dehydrogenase [Photobacterium sp. ZSDE20]MCQ1060829.1 iron-containing alcohol dehydrogenase [Photobacterium sp. ZSDE20]MDD1828597.1 iron-containing alcohol dehydrogenase [Photobacterium sp. ZSDE20]